MPYSGPATATVGTATSRPSASVMPTFACRIAMAASGPGCGGMKPCSTDSPASAGMPSRIAGPCERCTASITTGISSTSPISKNIGMPMIAAISAIFHGSVAGRPRSSVSTTLSAPPESASSLPTIAPSAISTPT